MRAIRKEENNTVNPRFQIILMVVTTTILMYCFYLEYASFRCTDDYPPVIALTPQELFKLGGSPSVIDTGIFVKSFSEFDIVKGQFLVNLTIWFKFNPDYISLDQIGKFAFQKAEIKSKSEPSLKIDGNDFIASYDMDVLFYISLNYSNFPFDDHRLSFIVDNYAIPSSQGNFVTSKHSIDVSSEIHIEGWHLRDTSAEFGYCKEEAVEDEGVKIMYHPRAVFLFEFSQSGIRYMFSIFLPLLMIFFTTLFSFSINMEGESHYYLVEMSSTSLAALIAFRFVMETISPATGYFIVSDYVFVFFLVVQLFIFLINVYGNAITRLQKSIIVVGLHMSVIIMFLYLLEPWK